MLLALVLAGAVVALRGRLQEVGDAGGLPHPAAIALVLLTALVGDVLLVDAWRALVAAASGVRLSLRAAARVWTASQLARYTLGAAQVPGRALAGRAHGVGAGVGTLTTLVEIVWGAGLTAVLALLTAPAWVGAGHRQGWGVLLALPPTVLVVVGLAAPRAVLGLSARALARLGARRFADSVAGVPVDRRLVAAVTARYAAVITLRVAGTLVLYQAVGGDPLAGAALAAGAWALGQLAGQAAVFAPGGLGVREGVAAAVLAPAIGAEAALLLVALTRLAELVAEVGLLALSTRPTAATRRPR